jgi:serine protease
MASPHVAGSAALVMGLGLGDASSVRDALTRTARASAAGDNPSLYGAGIVDAAAAIQQVFVRHLFARLGATLVFLWWVWRRIRSRRGSMSLTPGVLFGAMAGGIGALPFLPMLRVLPRLGAWRWLGELAMRPFGEWDAGWSMGVHHWLPLANAIPVGFGMALFFGVKRLRPTLGGFAVGMTALLAQLAFSLDVTMPFGALATRLWLVANAAICLWLARTALEAERAS